MSQPRPLDALGVAAVLLLCVSWGFQQPAIKLALADVPPGTQAAIRSAGAAMLVGLWMRLRGERFNFGDGMLWPGIGAGLLFGIEFLFMYTALNLTDASRAVVFIYVAPFVVAIGSHVLLGTDRMGWRGWLGIVVAFVGMVVALQPWAAARSSFLGDACALLAGFFWGSTTLLIKGTRLRAAPAATALQYQLVVSAPVLLAGGLLMGEQMNWPWTPLTWGAILFQTVWVVAITFGIWFALIARYSPSRLSVFTFITPLITMAVGHFLLGEVLTPVFLGAGALVIAGLVLVSWPAKPA